MVSRNVLGKAVGKSSSTTRSDDASLVGPWTCSKSKVVATIANCIGDDRTRTQTIITLGARKDESFESKKLASILEDSVSNEVSHDKSPYAFDTDLSTGSRSKSPTKSRGS
ncbi:hypothetical protein ACH5RR_022856 [Cinchona calisaya]|uniref:Uncharacterized protein n=1 Tax=Cinchona calisaya TaxID=153742 RepID=A0ABD2Z910_9GENT